MDELNLLLEQNQKYAAGFMLGGLQGRAAKGLALLTCIDSRIEPLQALGLKPGDAKVLRNAGGRVTPDVLRSLAVAVATLGVRFIAVMQHTECAMSTMSNSGVKFAVSAAGGAISEDLDFLTIDDPKADLLNDVRAIKHSPLIPKVEAAVGWMYDVRTGLISEIVGPQSD